MKCFIKFLQKVLTKNEFGSEEASSTLTLIREIPAEKINMRLNDRFLLGENEISRLVFKCRYYSNILDTNMMLGYQGKHYSILNIEETEAKRWLLVTCSG